MFITLWTTLSRQHVCCKCIPCKHACIIQLLSGHLSLSTVSRCVCREEGIVLHAAASFATHVTGRQLVSEKDQVYAVWSSVLCSLPEHVDDSTWHDSIQIYSPLATQQCWDYLQFSIIYTWPCAVQPCTLYNNTTLKLLYDQQKCCHNVVLEVPTPPAECMYRQVHATSLSFNILHITCLSFCIQWLQETTPPTPLPLVTEHHCQWLRHACHAKVNIIQYTKVYQIVSAVRAGEAVWYT